MNNETYLYGEEKVVGKVPEGNVHFLASLDGKIPFALTYFKGKTEYSPHKYKILYGDVYTNSFDGCSQVALNPDGKSVLYIINSDEKNYLYLNDKKLQESDEKMGDVEFSNDGKNYAYSLEKDGLWEVYLNDVKVWDGFEYHSVLLFLEGGSLDFLAGRDGVWHYYSTKKGMLPDEFKEVDWIFASPVCDKTALFCVKASDEAWYVYINDKGILGPFDAMEMPVATSFLRTKFAFTVSKDNNCYIYVDGQKIDRAFELVDFLAFLPNDKDIVCTEIKDDGTRIYLNDKFIAGPFEKLGFEIVFSKDCKRMYYSKCDNGKWSIGHTDFDDAEMTYVKDIDVNIPCEEVFNILVSADLSKIFYSTTVRGKIFFHEKIVISLGELGTFGAFERVDFFKISDDGSVVAFMALEGKKWYLYVNGKKVAGPFISVSGVDFFRNTSIILYKAVISKEEELPIFMMYMDGKNYTGLVDAHRMVYMDGTKIISRERLQD